MSDVLELETAGAGSSAFRREIEAAEQLCKQGRWVVAERQLAALAQKHPNAARVQTLLGHALLKQRRYLEAEAALIKANAAKPGQIPATLDLADCYIQRSRLDLAGRLLDSLEAMHGRKIGAAEPLRRMLKHNQKAASDLSNIVALVEQLETALSDGRLKEALKLQKKIKVHDEALRQAKWSQDPILARAAYFCFNPNDEATLERYKPEWFDAAVECDFLAWPTRVHDWVEGRTVADIGCGHGAYSLGFVVAGAKTYSGIDPVIDLDSHNARNKRRRRDVPFPCTPREIAAHFPQVEIRPGTFESLRHERTFDVIVMHNVSEHLIQIREVLNGLRDIMHDKSELVFLHHNFYCWNGHHLRPKTPAELNEKDTEQQKYFDWRHVTFDPPEDHYIATNLNRIRLDELKAICDELFDVAVWDEINSSKETLKRLTPEIKAGLPDFTERELSVNAVFVVARKKA